MAGKKGQKVNVETSKRNYYYWQTQNPDWTVEQCKEKAEWFKKSCNYQCIEYYEKKYPELSHEEHLKLKEQLQEQKKHNQNTNIKYWIQRYPEKSLEELEKLRSNAAKENNKCNFEYWIKKYPEKSLEELKSLHNKFYQSWLSHQEGWGKGEKNCNHKNNSTQEKRNSKSPRNIAFYETKYPELSHEEHLKMLNDFFEKNRLAVKNTIKDTNIEYYLNQGMSEEEAKKALKDRQSTFSLEKCIKKYGEVEGVKRFSERQQKWLKNLYINFQSNGDGRSKQSKFAKELIGIFCKNLNIQCPKKEKYIYWKKTNQAFAYDFIFKDKIIEFNGDYWHCNPKLYEPNFYNKVKQKTAQEIWENDKIKKECAEYYGYKLLYVWEYDYINDKENIIKKCMEFLNK